MAWDDINWGDIWNKVTSPGAITLGGLGLGVYGAYDQARQQRAVQRQQDAYRAQQQAAIDAYNRMYQDYQGRQAADIQGYYDSMAGWRDMISGVATGSVAPYMQDITDAERAAILRTPKANMAERGIQPGGYWDSISAEVLAKDAEGRYAQALNARGQTLQSLLGAHPPTPIFGAQPAMPQYPAAPYVGNPINYGGMANPLQGYAQYQQLLEALNRVKKGNTPETPSEMPRTWNDQEPLDWFQQ